MQQEKVKSLKINVTNLRSALLDANKTLEEISNEKKSLLEKQVQQQKIKEKEDKLTTKKSPLKKAGEAVKSAAKSVQGFFDKVIQFGATILIGQLITALPGLIEKFKEWKERNKNLINFAFKTLQLIGTGLKNITEFFTGVNFDDQDKRKEEINKEVEVLNKNLDVIDKETEEFGGEASQEESSGSDNVNENKEFNKSIGKENNTKIDKDPADKKTTISQGSGSDIQLDPTERDGVGVLSEEDRKKFKVSKTGLDKSRIEKNLADAYVRKNEYIQSGDTSKLNGVNKKIENYEKQLNIMSPTLIIKSNDQSKRIDTIKSKNTNGSSEKQKIIVMTKTVEKNVPVLDTMPVGVA